MDTTFTILGRGRAGRALAAAWGSRVRLAPADASPQGWVLLAVPDHAIPALAARFQGRCVHMSGSLHMPGVPCAHPLTSFQGQARDWRGVPLALTGDVPPLVQGAFEAIGFVPFPLEGALKPLYHACAVLASGHAATLWLGAESILRQAGIDLPGRGLLPLAESTLENVRELGQAGRTGPFVRGDAATIARDAAALPAGWRELFLALGNMTI